MPYEEYWKNSMKIERQVQFFTKFSLKLRGEGGEALFFGQFSGFWYVLAKDNSFPTSYRTCLYDKFEPRYKAKRATKWSEK